MATMTLTDQISAARDQLSRLLGFFPRVDTKASVVLAVNTSMLAVLATRAFPYNHFRWELLPAALTLGVLAISFWHLYREAFPVLTGGHESLLYFREIAKRTEPKFHDAWKGLSDEEYLSDLLGQVWRNSEILTQKFDHLRIAFLALALALLPWALSLALLSGPSILPR